MQRFEFPLEKVRSWRQSELQAEEARLAPLVAEQVRLEECRRQIADARATADRELLAAATVEGFDLEALARYRVGLENRRAGIERELAGCRDAMARQRARIMEAHRRLRLLEKLRERRFGEWQTAWERELNAFASEGYLARWRPPRRL